MASPLVFELFGVLADTYVVSGWVWELSPERDLPTEESGGDVSDDILQVGLQTSRLRVVLWHPLAALLEPAGEGDPLSEPFSKDTDVTHRKLAGTEEQQTGEDSHAGIYTVPLCPT